MWLHLFILIGLGLKHTTLDQKTQVTHAVGKSMDTVRVNQVHQSQQWAINFNVPWNFDSVSNKKKNFAP